MIFNESSIVPFTADWGLISFARYGHLIPLFGLNNLIVFPLIDDQSYKLCANTLSRGGLHPRTVIDYSDETPFRDNRATLATGCVIVAGWEQCSLPRSLCAVRIALSSWESFCVLLTKPLFSKHIKLFFGFLPEFHVCATQET